MQVAEIAIGDIFRLITFALGADFFFSLGSFSALPANLKSKLILK